MRIKNIKQGARNLTKEKARIIAHLIGDGAHYRTGHDYVLKYEVRDEESLKTFSDDIIKVYGLTPSWEWNTSGITGKPIRFVRLRSKLAFEDLKRYATFSSKNWRLKPKLLDSAEEIRKEFLRALFDDDGSVKSSTEVCLYSINQEGLDQIKEMLVDFGIKSHISQGYGSKRNVYGLLIKDLTTFSERIGFNLRRKQAKLDRLLNGCVDVFYFFAFHVV